MDSSKRHQIARFIRNSIAPGGRAFISFEIEQAIRKSFGEYQVEAKGENFPLSALWDGDYAAHTAVLEKMHKVSQQIFNSYQRQEQVDYNDELNSIYYSLYYLPRNIHKIQFILLDLFEREMLPETIHALDLGSAVGTVPLAVADFFNLLRNTCSLFTVQETFKPNVVSFSCVDASDVNLKNLRKIWGNLIVSSDGFASPETHLVSIGHEKNWQNQIQTGPFNLIFASNFLNELTAINIPGRADLVEEFASQMTNDGLIVLIEPADETNAKNLHALQSELVRRGFHVQLPCLESCSSNGEGESCSNCWAWRSEAIRLPAISRSLTWNNSLQDEEYIKWCYSIIGKRAKLQLSEPLSKLGDLSLGEMDLRVQAISPLIGQKWVKICGSDGNSGCAVLELDEHQVITAFTPGDVLNLQRIEVNSPVRSGLFSGMKRIRFTVKSHSNRGELHSVIPDVRRQPIDRIEEKEEVLRYFLQRLFGFNSLRPGQFEIISRILAGKDTFGIMATSAGKSLCFQFPAMLLPGITLVVAPLKSLVQDQISNLQRMGFDNVTRIDSDAESIEDALNRIMEGYYKLVYITPEQLTNERVVAKLHEAGKRHGFSLFAVDEVHCLSQWGHDFRPAYLNLYRHFRDLEPCAEKTVPILGLTATASEYVIDDVLTSLHLDRSAIVRQSFDRPELSFEVVSIELDDDRLEKIIQLLDTHLPKVIQHPIWPGIIFVPYTGDELDQSTEMYRFSAEGLAAALKERGYNTAFYHSAMGVSDREQVQDDFKNGNIDILVATKGFGMGIDKEDIRFIIHYSMPESLESYYQQSGRAGRSGEHSHCILVYQNPSTGKHDDENYQTDYSRQEYFINEKYPGAPEQIRQAWDYLRNPQSESRGSPDRDVLYVDPEKTLVEIGWISEEDLKHAKEAKSAVEEWDIFKKDWNKLIQILEQSVISQRTIHSKTDFLKKIKPVDREILPNDWDYLLYRIKNRQVRASIQERLIAILRSYGNEGHLAAGVVEKFRSQKPDRKPVKLLDDQHKNLERVFNALQRMGYISLWNSIQTVATIQRRKSWAEIEMLVPDPFVQKFIQSFKTKTTPAKFSEIPHGNPQETDLVSLYKSVGMDVIQLHAVLDYLKKRQLLTVIYKQSQWIVRINPDWIHITPEEQARRFDVELDLLEQRHQREYDMLNSMQRYIDTTSCRRQSIVGYFLQKNQDKVIVRCNFCDNCCPNGIYGERAEVELASRWQLEIVQNIQRILEDDLPLPSKPTSSRIEYIQQVVTEMHPQGNEASIWDIVSSMCDSHLENRCVSSWRAPLLQMLMEFEQGHSEPGLRYFRRLKLHDQLKGQNDLILQLALIVQNYCPIEYDVVETLYETVSALSMPEQKQYEYLHQLISIDYDRKPDYLFRIGVYEQRQGISNANSHLSDAFQHWIKLGQLTSAKSGITQLAKEGFYIEEDMLSWISRLIEQDHMLGLSLIEDLVLYKSLDKILLQSVNSIFPSLPTEPKFLQRIAKIARLLNDATLEVMCHQRLLLIAEDDQSIDRFTSHASLVELFAEGGPAQDIQAYILHARDAARSANDILTVLKYYRLICKFWTIQNFDEEIHWVEQQQHSGWEEIVKGLVFEWKAFFQTKEHNLELLELLLQWKVNGRSCFRIATSILSSIPFTEIDKFPQLLPDWIICQPKTIPDTSNLIESFITDLPEPDIDIKRMLVEHVFHSLENSKVFPDISTADRCKTFIQNICISMLQQPSISIEIHKLWQKICLYWPGFYFEYLKLLVEQPIIGEDILVEAFDFSLRNEAIIKENGVVETIVQTFKTSPQIFPPAFITTALLKLAINASDEIKNDFAEILRICLSLPTHTRQDYINAFSICQTAHQEEFELTLRETACLDDIFLGDTTVLIENSIYLARHYSVGSPNSNQEKCFYYCLQAAILDKDLFSEKQLLPYRGFIAQNSWESLRSDLKQIETTPANPYLCPLFLSIWLRYSHSGDELESVCAHITEHSRFLSWQADDTEDVLNMIDIEILSNHPVLIEFLINRAGKFLDRFKSQSSWAFTESIALLKKGFHFPDLQAKEIWESIQLISSDSLAEYFERLLPDTSIARAFFTNFLPDGAELNVNTCVALFMRYSVDTLCKEYPELGIKILKSAAAMNWGNPQKINWQGLKNNLRALFNLLIMDSKYQKEAYEAWLGTCKIWPDEGVSALNLLLTNHSEYSSVIDQYWACVIEKIDVTSLDAIIKDIRRYPDKVLTQRIKYGLQFVELVDELGRQSDIGMSYSLEGRHFRDVFLVFKPKKNLERADMVVSLLEVLRKKLKPGWLTPLSFYLEALAYAGLMDEASTIARNTPDLRVGAQKTLALDYLSGFKNNNHRVENFREDYLKLAQILTSEWIISSK